MVVVVWVVAIVLLLALATALVVGRAFTRLRRRPANGPASRGPGTAKGRTRIVFLGASTMHGNVSFNIVDELRRRLPDHELINAGVNGNTSRQALGRLPAVLACRPDIVVVQVGANDVLALRGSPLGSPVARNLAERPTWERYADNLTAIADGLRPGGARVALMSIQPIGERLDAEINKDVEHANELVRRTATVEKVTYLPLYERLAEVIAEDGEHRPVRESVAEVVKATVLHLGLGISLDRIGRRNGYVVHTDGLHLSSRGGLVAADLIEDFIRQDAVRPS